MLKRFEARFNNVFSTDLVDMEVLEKGVDKFILRQNSDNDLVYQCAAYQPQNLFLKLTQLKMMLKGTCERLRLFYDVGSYASIIIEDLRLQRKEDDNIWYHEDTDYFITARLNPPFTDYNFVVDVIAKKSSGIPSNVALFFEQVIGVLEQKRQAS